MELGTKEEWDEAAAGVSERETVFLRKVRLWLDSSDFALRRKKEWRNKKGPMFSYKENHPAQRYMMLSDGKTRIRRLWGGFSPKVYDSDSTLQILPPLAERLKGVDLIADNHFLSTAKALAGRICIHAPTAERDRSETEFDEETIRTGVGLSFPTREESQRNASIRHLRSPVERPFGKLKTLFKCFKPYWPGNPERQNKAVYFACGVHNWRIDNMHLLSPQ